MYRYIFVFFIALFPTLNILAAGSIPVSWSVKFSESGKDNAELIFSADISDGWEVYGLQLPDGGPRSTRVVIEEGTGIKINGPLYEIIPYQEKYDTLFELILKSYSKKATLALPLEIVSHPINISGYIIYQASNQKTCTPPTRYRFNINIPGKTDIGESAYSASKENIGSERIKTEEVIRWNSAKDIIQQIGETDQPKAITALDLLNRGFGNGLLALCFPSLWPIILMTIYSFRKIRSSRKLLLIKIFSYDLTLIILFPFTGLLITQLFGYDFFSEINGNIYFNTAMFLISLILAGYLFGVKGTRLPEKAPASIRLMVLGTTVLILVLSSTGRFTGQILKESGSFEPITGPLILFFGFISAFVTVTTIICLISNWNTATLESKARLTTLNRVVGFFILSYSLTFLSDINLSYGYNIIGRDTFIAIWISIYAVLGVYLLGAFSFFRDRDNSVPKITMKRLITAIASFSFCMYMIPGLWGAPLSIINLMIPPSYTQEFSIYDNYKDNLFNDYDEGMSYAYSHEKPVLLTFTSVGDAESRFMESMLWNFTPIRTVLNNEFVIIALKTDSKEVLPQSRLVSIEGKTIRVKTYGELWTALQKERFGSTSKPYQIILSPYGEPLSGALGYSDSAKEYLEFLFKALNRYKKQYDETE